MARFKIVSSVALGEWLVALLLGADLVWTTLCLGGYRPETMALSWLLTALALAAQLGFAAWQGRRPHRAGLLLLPFLGYAAFNVAAVSPVSWLGWRDWLGWFQLVAVFWMMVNGVSRRGPRALLLGTLAGLGTLAVLLAAYQRFVAPDWLMLGRTQAPQFFGRASGPFGIPNTLAAFLLLLIPPVLSLTWQRGASAAERVFWGYFSAVFLLGLGLTISRGAWLSLVAVLIAWPFCARRLSLQMRVVLACTAFAAAVGAGLVLYSSVPQVRQRVDALVADAGERSRPILWEASLKLWLDAPVLGTGGGSYNTLFERYRPEGFRDEPQWAHNDYLNTLSDYGSLGFLLLFGAVVAVVAAASQHRGPGLEREALTGWEGPGATTGLVLGLVAFAVSLLVDFHLKIPALSMAVAVVGGELIQRLWPAKAEPVASINWRVGLLSSSLVLVLFAVGVAVPVYRAEAARYEGRQAIDRLALNPAATLNEQRQVLTQSALAFSEAVSLDSGNGQAWADRAYATELWARLAPAQMNELGRDAETYANEALSRSLDVPEFWVRRGVALDMQGRWEDSGEAFMKALELARFNATYWFYYAYHQSLRPHNGSEVNKSIENCLRLDPENGSALALRQRINQSP